MTTAEPPPVIRTYSRKAKGAAEPTEGAVVALSLALPSDDSRSNSFGFDSSVVVVAEAAADAAASKKRAREPRPTLFEQLMTSAGSGAPLAEQSKKKKKKAPASKQQQQLFIDAGQREFASSTCPVCGLVFARGTEDERLHAAFHRRETAPVHCASWATSSERVVSQRDVNGFAVVAYPVAGPELASLDKPVRRAVEETLSMVDKALGFALESPRRRASSSSAMRMYVLVDKANRAVGAVVAERVSSAHRVLPSSSTADGGSVACRNEEERAVAGVSRIWVHPDSRRKGAATRLLDVLRADFVYGFPVPKELLAFSQPTPDGMQFFARYSGTKEFLVYS